MATSSARVRGARAAARTSRVVSSARVRAVVATSSVRGRAPLGRRATQQRSGQSTSGTSSGQNQQGSQQRSGPSGTSWVPAASGGGPTGGDRRRFRRAAAPPSASGTGAASSSSSSSATNVNISNEQRTRIAETRSTLPFKQPEGDPLATARGPRRRRRDAAPHRCPRCRTVPKQIVSIIPRFRGYRYIIVEDDIVIIDPKTYRVVYVIEG